MIPALLLALSATGSTPPIPATSEQIVALRCGNDELRMSSQVLTSKTAPLSPVSQTLTRHVGAQNVRVALEPSHSIEVSGHRVQDRYAASWACVTGSHKARHVLIGYACAVDTGNAGDCGGRKEWFRLLDQRGRFADAGVPDGAPRDQLYTRLGIANAMANGIALTPVIK